MSHQLGRRGCGRSSVSNRLVLVAELAGDDLPYVRLFESLRKKRSDRKRKEQQGLNWRIYKSKSKSYLSKRLIVRHYYGVHRMTSSIIPDGAGAQLDFSSLQSPEAKTYPDEVNL